MCTALLSAGGIPGAAGEVSELDHLSLAGFLAAKTLFWYLE